MGQRRYSPCPDNTEPKKSKYFFVEKEVEAVIERHKIAGI